MAGEKKVPPGKKDKEGLMSNIAKIILSYLTKEILEKVVEKAPEYFVRMKSWWSGRTIAVIGPTASGKNSLFDRIKDLPPPGQHIQTRGAEAVGNFDVSWGVGGRDKIEFKCKRSINVGGEIDERERFWGQACADADVVFYLVDFQKLLENRESSIDRVRDDFKWIASRLKSFKQGVKFHILLNKVDKIEFSGEPEDHRDHIVKLVKEESIKIQNIAHKFFGDQKAAIVGVSPISMIDDYLFRTFFTSVLSEVFAEVTKK